MRDILRYEDEILGRYRTKARIIEDQLSLKQSFYIRISIYKYPHNTVIRQTNLLVMFLSHVITI